MGLIALRIFQVAPYFPPHLGGMETYLYMLSKELAERGHDVTIFTSSDKSFSYKENVDGFEVHRVSSIGRIYNVPIAPSLLPTMIRKRKPDIVHGHQYPVFFSDVSSMASRFLKTPFLLHVHVVAEPKSLFSNLVSSVYYRSIGKFPLNHASLVVTPSFAYKRTLFEMGVPEQKIRVVPYGIDMSRFNPKNNGGAFRKKYGCEDSELILSVGRLNYQKGFNYLIEAAPEVLRSFPNAKFVIVGGGEELGSLKDLSARLGLSGSIVFTGAISPLEIPQSYAAADVFVLPSLFESLGIAIIEAEATGKPVVCTRVGGAPETLLEGESGFVVEPREPHQLAEAIVKLLSDCKAAKLMGQKGRKYVENKFEWRRNVCRILELYAEMQTQSFLN